MSEAAAQDAHDAQDARRARGARGARGSPGARPLRRRPRIRTVLLLVHLVILALPLAGIAELRLYENELIRGTESQLLLLGAVVRDVYLAQLRAGADQEAQTPAALASLGELRPLEPRLDIGSDPVLPPAPPADPPPGPPDPRATAAGARVAPALASSARSTLAGIRIVDAQGIVVATTRSESGMSLAAREEVRRALAGEVVTLLRERRSDEAYPALESVARGQRYRVFVALPVTDEGVVRGAVVLSRTPLDIQKALYLNRRPVLVGTAAVLGAVVAVSLITAFAISRPVDRLIAQAERVARGEPGGSLEVRRPGTHEVARLSRSLAEMEETLQQRAEYIRTFAAHVSHEFKGSLTSIRGSVELLRDHGETMTPGERARFLLAIDETAARLDRLVRRLLEQARADVLRPDDEARADVDAVAATVARRLREAGLDVAVEGEAGGARVAADALDRMMTNLLENAREHGGGGVRVQVRLARADGAVLVAVEDDGPGVSAANRERVFTPFFTTARERGGSGLGLSIVRALAEAHGGSAQLDETAPRGARFELRLPAA